MPELTIAKSLSKAYHQVCIDKQLFDVFIAYIGICLFS